MSAIVHGVLILGSVALLPAYLNLIPESCLAAILFMTGLKLASYDVATGEMEYLVSQGVNAEAATGAQS